MSRLHSTRGWVGFGVERVPQWERNLHGATARVTLWLGYWALWA